MCVVGGRSVEGGLAAARVHSKEGVHSVAKLIKKRRRRRKNVIQSPAELMPCFFDGILQWRRTAGPQRPPENTSGRDAMCGRTQRSALISTFRAPV